MFACFGVFFFFQVLRRAGSDTFTKQINGKNKVNSDLLWMFFLRTQITKKRDHFDFESSLSDRLSRHHRGAAFHCFTLISNLWIIRDMHWFLQCYSHKSTVFNKIFHLPEVVLGSWHCAFWLTSMVYWDIWCSEIYFTCVFLLLRSSWSCPGTGIYLRQTSRTIFN